MSNYTTNDSPIKLCECGCGQEVPLSKYPGYQRKFLSGHRGFLPFTDRFWSKVNIKSPEECWNWLAMCNKKGYGLFRINYKVYKAHRISWQINFGPIGENLLVCHKCDNPACVNPKHLFLGTPLDNTKDMQLKNRQYYPTGEKAGNAKLTTEEVNQIRNLAKQGLHQRKIAKIFGISNSYVSALVNYKWRKKD